jgi:YVTN family beta-propeller protein
MKRWILLSVLLAVFLSPLTAFASPFAYITNNASNTVSVVDTATNTVTANVAVGTGPTGVAVNAAATRVYVTNSTSSTVSVINTSTNTVSATVAVGIGPVGIAVNRAGTMVYVANRLSNSVSVIDTSTNTVTATVNVGSGPYGIAVNVAGTRVYVANNTSNTVSVIDTSSNTVIATVNVGSGPQGLTLDPADSRVYVANNLSGTVSVIDTSTNTMLSTVTVGAGPKTVAINPAGTMAYVTNSVPGNVSIIDTSTILVVGSPVNVGVGPAGAAVNPLGTMIYVANQTSNTISVIDVATNTVITTISAGLGSGPVALGNFFENVPQVISTLPASEARSVSRDTLVSAKFSTDMDATTITTSTFTVSGVTGTVGYDASTRTATFTPASSLSELTIYTATITTGVKDTLGHSMMSNYTWTFITSSEHSTGACFIATAAYGSPLAHHVEVLRNFRNRYLLTNPVGQTFCRFYSRYSPPIAEIISRHEFLKTTTQWALSPLIFVIEYPLCLGFIVILGAAISLSRRRR